MPWSRPAIPLNMQSLGKSLQEPPPSTDLPAVKGILTLLVCIMYAAVLFIAAAIGSKLVTSFSTSGKRCLSPPVLIYEWIFVDVIYLVVIF